MRKIVFVSRLDADCSLGASLLCEIAPKLAEKYHDLQIFIIGGGTEYIKIRQKSYQINQALNRKLIIAVGETENPSLYFDKNTLFLGVSRAALEAMAHSLPVILIGNEGYLGLLDESKLVFAKKTNFTCRNSGSNMTKSELSTSLFRDICHFFELSKEEKSHLASLSYETIKNEYSAQDMAKQTLEFYQETLKNYHKMSTFSRKKAPKIAICGYYGHGNLGDEAILSVILEKLNSRFKNPNIRVLKSKNPFKNFRALCGADYFIFGGGSLLQNSTSNASLFYYLTIIHAAHLLCKRKIMLSNGIGPLKSGFFTLNFLNNMLARAIDTFDFISVRDATSEKTLSSLLPSRKIHLIPDPALICTQNVNTELMQKTEKEYFLYIPCANSLKNNKISINSLASGLSEVAKIHSLPLAIAIFNPQEDLTLAKQLKVLMNNVKIFVPRSSNEYFKLLEGAKFVISQRYHGALLSTVLSIPTLAVSSDPKMHALCEELKLINAQNPIILTRDKELLDKITTLLSSHSVQSSLILEKCQHNSHLANTKMENLISKL